MKQLLAGGFFCAAGVWALWCLAVPEPCVRVHRAAAPVRLVGDIFRASTENWLPVEDRLRLLEWTVGADESSQAFLKHHFYGDQLSCEAGHANS